MTKELKELRVFQMAEELADATWKLVQGWNQFAKVTVGEQLVRAADRVGATISEAHGRYHFGEKLQFIYYSRGSLYETRFWLRQAFKRKLMTTEEAQSFAKLLEPMALSINNFANSIRDLRSTTTLKESRPAYGVTDPITNSPITGYHSDDIFSETEILWLTNLTDANAS